MSAAAPVPRRIRRAARIILFDARGRLLLFRFTVADRAPFWCLPGGECEGDEDFPTAARRELAEETGIIAEPGAMVAREGGDFVTLAGEPVVGDECFFVVHTTATAIDTSGHTEQERAAMRDHRWFAPDEIATWRETIYPHSLTAMLAAL